MTKLKQLNLGLRICFELRHSFFEFMKRILNDYTLNRPSYDKSGDDDA